MGWASLVKLYILFIFELKRSKHNLYGKTIKKQLYIYLTSNSYSVFDDIKIRREKKNKIGMCKGLNILPGAKF